MTSSVFFILAASLPQIASGAPTMWLVDQGGGGDFTTITGAVTAASPGDTILVNAGTYTEQVAINKNGLTLIGAGAASTIIDPGSGNTGIGIYGVWINISGFKITSGSVGIGIAQSKNCKIYNNEIKYSSQYGIELSTSVLCNISSNIINNCKYYGIRITDSDNNVFYRNHVNKCDYNIQIYQSSDNLFIKNILNNSNRGINNEMFSHSNYFSHNNISSNVNYGIYSSWSDHLTFENNFINDTDEHSMFLSRCNDIRAERNSIDGFYIAVRTSYCIGARFVDNDIRNGYMGPWLWYDESGFYSGNTISGIDEYGIEIFESTSMRFEQNRFTGCGFHISAEKLPQWNTHTIPATNTVNGVRALYLKNGSSLNVQGKAGQLILTNVTSTTISGLDLSDSSVGPLLGFANRNTLKDMISNDNKHGIEVFRSTGNSFSNITVRNATVYGAYIIFSDNTRISDSEVDNCPYGVYIRGSRNNTVDSCRVHGSVHAGIYATWWDSRIVDGNVFIDNLIENDQEGILMQGCNNTIISGNTIRSIPYTGILVTNQPSYGPSTNITVTDNEVSLAGRYGILVNNGARYLRVAENHLHNNSQTGLQLMDVFQAEISGNNLTGNMEPGLSIFQTKDVEISNNTITENGFSGMVLEYSDLVSVAGNNMTAVTNQPEGMSLNHLTNSTLHTNIISGHSVGFTAYHSRNVLFYDNLFDNDVNHGSLSSNSRLRWNISRTNGTNIIGGPFLGGNYWNDYFGKDMDGDGFGDQMLPHGPGDHLPLQFDIIPPALRDNTTDTPFTGELFRFSLLVTDEREAGKAHAEYRINNGTLHNVTMTRGFNNEFFRDMLIPDNETGVLYYRFTAVDSSGNWNHTGNYSKIIQDGTEPTLEYLTIPERPLFGDPIRISIDAYDNVELDRVRISYIDVSGQTFTEPMIHGDGRVYYFDIPPQETIGNITVWVTAEDPSGNRFESVKRTFHVGDEIPPTADFVGISSGIVIGDGLDLVFNWSDPVGRTVSILITARGPASIDIFSGAPSGDISMMVRWNTTDVPEGNYTVTLLVTDDMENENTTSIMVFVDHTPPTISLEHSSSVYIGQEHVINASGSFDLFGPLNYVWYSDRLPSQITGQGNNILNFGPVLRWTPPETGIFGFRLDVWDIAGNVNSTEVAIIVDLYPGPEVISTAPENGAQNVPVDQEVMIEFDLSMNTVSVAESLRVNPPVPFTLAWENGSSVLHMVFNTTLEHDTSYTLTIPSALPENPNRAPLETFTLSFRTAEKPSSPVLIIQSPSEDGHYETGMEITVSGISNNLEPGSIVTVVLNGKTYEAEITQFGFWMVDIKLPGSSGTYTLTAMSGGISDSVTFEIVEASGEQGGLGDAGIFFIITLVLLIVLIVAFVLWKRNRDRRDIYYEE